MHKVYFKDIFEGSKSMLLIKHTWPSAIWLGTYFKLDIFFFLVAISVSYFIWRPVYLAFKLPILLLFLLKGKHVSSPDCYGIRINEMIREIFLFWSFTLRDIMMSMKQKIGQIYTHYVCLHFIYLIRTDIVQKLVFSKA